MPRICAWLSSPRIAALLAGSSTSPNDMSDLKCSGFCSVSFFFYKHTHTHRRTTKRNATCTRCSKNTKVGKRERNNWRVHRRKQNERQEHPFSSTANCRCVTGKKRRRKKKTVTSEYLLFLHGVLTETRLRWYKTKNAVIIIVTR